MADTKEKPVADTNGEDADSGEPPAKRGRGRPKKPESEKKAKPPKDPNAPKRGRGRPKGSFKKKKAAPAAAAGGTAKRGRGRPKKE